MNFHLIASILEGIYLLVVLWMAAYGVSSLINLYLYRRAKRARRTLGTESSMQEWPPVTIQLPIFNEKYTVQRLLKAVSRLDYPIERLQIQVLDDSTDDTAALVSRLVDEYRRQGLNMLWLHRDNRAGYKAGALRDALPKATGELVGIFDADFVPEPDWLRRTVPMFRDSELGCVQTRWGHTNRSSNSLTRAEALAVDAHFLIEQSARSGNGLFLNFNGTAGLWRRECIEEAGGWQPDTLTEDLDLSYRAQLAGWRIDYLPDVVVPAELPSQVEAYKKQQFRWAKGSFQVVRKILPMVLQRSDLPWKKRLMAVLHLTGYAVHPLMVSMLLLTLPVGLLAPAAFKILPFTFVAGLGPPLMVLFAAGRRSPSLGERARLLPLLTITGFGISLNTTIAVLEGLTGTGSKIFVRTPKLNESDAVRRRRIDHTYLEPVSPLVWAEIGLGAYALLTGFMLVAALGWEILPWMLIYAAGYFYVAGLNLAQHINFASAKSGHALAT